MNAHDLNKLVQDHGLDPGLAKRLEPYLGMKRRQGQAFLASNPLKISVAEAEQLTNAKYADFAQSLEEKFDAAMAAQNSTVTFASLPRKLKTVVLSVSLQHGLDLPKKTRNFWGYLIAGDLPGLIGELRNFQDAFPSRRNREAVYLSQPAP